MVGEPWHLDKRVPLALILTIVLQTAGVVWWAAGIAAQVTHHERQLQTLAAYDAADLQEKRRTAELLARLEERLVAQTEILRRMEMRLAGARLGSGDSNP